MSTLEMRARASGVISLLATTEASARAARKAMVEHIADPSLATAQHVEAALRELVAMAASAKREARAVVSMSTAHTTPAAATARFLAHDRHSTEPKGAA